MHTCFEAKKYNGQIWTCNTDEFSIGNQRLVFLDGFRGGFAVEYLQKVNIEPQHEPFEKQRVAWVILAAVEDVLKRSKAELKSINKEIDILANKKADIDKKALFRHRDFLIMKIDLLKSALIQLNMEEK